VSVLGLAHSFKVETLEIAKEFRVKDKGDFDDLGESIEELAIRKGSKVVGIDDDLTGMGYRADHILCLEIHTCLSPDSGIDHSEQRSGMVDDIPESTHVDGTGKSSHIEDHSTSDDIHLRMSVYLCLIEEV